MNSNDMNLDAEQEDPLDRLSGFEEIEINTMSSPGEMETDYPPYMSFTPETPAMNFRQIRGGDKLAQPVFGSSAPSNGLLFMRKSPAAAAQLSPDLSDIKLEPINSNSNEAIATGGVGMNINVKRLRQSASGTKFSASAPVTENLNEAILKDKIKKASHNQVERRRRFQINENIQKLGELVPQSNNNEFKSHKGEILKAAVEYMNKLISEKEGDAKRILELEQMLAGSTAPEVNHGGDYQRLVRENDLLRQENQQFRNEINAILAAGGQQVKDGQPPPQQQQQLPAFVQQQLPQQQSEISFASLPQLSPNQILFSSASQSPGNGAGGHVMLRDEDIRLIDNADFFLSPNSPML